MSDRPCALAPFAEDGGNCAKWGLPFHQRCYACRMRAIDALGAVCERWAQQYFGAIEMLMKKLAPVAEAYGRTASGRPINDELVGTLVARAERGYSTGQVGRPRLGTGVAKVESVRLDPELRAALHEAARLQERTPSEIIRDALNQYLGD
jgi:hypothetical protein